MRPKLRFVLGLVMASLILSGCAQVQGDEVGVRSFNIYFGVEKKAKKTGTYLYVPLLFDFYFFPKTQQKLEMVESEITPASGAEMEKKLQEIGRAHV